MPKPRIALLVNIVAPSRVRLYEHLAAALDLTILHGGAERNRDSWNGTSLKGARYKRMAGWQWSLARREDGEIFDHWFLHFEPGYVFELLRERPDGIVTFEMGFRTLVALAYGTLFRKPVWVWWGGTLRTERRVGRFRRSLRALIARWARHWISYGETSTEYLRSLGVPADRILQVQNCVDETWYAASAQPALEVHPHPVLLHVGQMIARKGIAEFLRAARRLQQEGINFSTILVGGGRDSAKLQRLAVQLGLDNVHFLPGQRAESMAGF
jgi:glycosyltransferase involved in cell wall biosynthesis